MTHFVTVDDGVRLACRVDGEKDLPPLVFSNSLGSDMRMWDAQVEGLSDSFHIIRYDVRGHGQSSVPHEQPTIERLGKDLLAVLDAHGIDRAHICGLSLGGLTAMWLAATHPERIERAVFANTAARIGTDEGWNARIEAVRAGGMAAVRDIVLSRFFSESFRLRHPDVARLAGDSVEAIDPAGYIAACAVLRDTDLRAIVPKIRTPSLIIGGDLDEPTPPADAQELHQAIAGSKLVVLEDAAHLSNIEQPGAFNALLLDFFTGSA